MVETAGTKLRRARVQRHLSLEDAARATKIRATQLADLESDDYSNFANLAYARGFLVSYGKYLHLDVRPYMEAFADANTFGLDDYQYLSAEPLGEYRAPTRPWRRRRQGNVRQLLMLAAGVAVLALAVFSFFLYVNYQRLGGNLGTLAERQADQAQGAGNASGDAAKPAMAPVSSAPLPTASAAPAFPEIAPSNDDNRAAAAALAVAGHDNSPTALLTQLAMPAVKAPGDANTPLTSPAPGGEASLLVHAPDKGADPFRAAAPKPQKVSNNALE